MKVRELKIPMADEIVQNQLEVENIKHNGIELNLNHENIIGNSVALHYVLFKTQKVAASSTTVLILGETGTGKELIAKAIHDSSKQNNHPLIKVDCTTLPSELIESELFGHEKGAFTGAIEKKIGRFELANNGTLFLDEIGELPLNLQPKLLRAIEYGEIERIGNPKTIKVNVRIIAATNRNLENEVINGKFRKDLYYRINVYPITLPPLRKRKEDIPALVQSFLRHFNKKIGREINIIPPEIMDRLIEYNWPGNIRELENVIERAIILSKTNVIEVEIPKEFYDVPFGRIMSLEEKERSYILEILEFTNGKIASPDGAAAILEIPPSTLRSKMKKLGIARSATSFEY
jgi:chemotaxis protein methyltransferase CheR